jgi:hypothetical protein
MIFSYKTAIQVMNSVNQSSKTGWLYARLKRKRAKVVRYRSDGDEHLEATGLVDGNIRD